ncbi:hypothetical protein HDC30_005761 [Pseudomonas sp. JAI115]|uniref:hypothetical protein n=1 Tax=Pseudomonas sp. JAI115 TaxID=2723061 RepID=UPI00160EFDBD|nr:hypothetical protein [Pseudomonas sp. JAI115]MBB6158503.1 hypothetical protein [Pseudomonas sp. JAI115]
MKTAKDVSDLAATLTAAASAPLVPAQAQKSAKKQIGEGETMQMTLRPTRKLYAIYVNKAAERSKLEGRNVSVQEVMLEVLTKGEHV